MSQLLEATMPNILAHTAFLAGIIICCATAEARIVCRDGYQLSGGQEISTPYCNDEYFAKVARQHGVKVTADEIRNNPSRKYELCRFLDSDIRVQDYCPVSGSSRDK